MQIKKDLTKILGGVLIGGLLLSGGMAFAGDAADSVTGKFSGMPFFGIGAKHGGGFGKGQFRVVKGMLSQETLNQLVKDGVITQAKADEIKAYVDKKKDETNGKTRGAGMGLMNELVTNKILTQEQADTIQAKTKEIAHTQKQQQLSESLKAVVEKGTITQEQADSILKKFEAAEKEREALLAKMENMTLKEIRESKVDIKGTRNPMEQLVSEGVITQEQVDAIQKSNMETAQKQNLQRISDSLKALVDKGTITQDQADKIVKKIEDTQKEREALLEKIKNMTEEERHQYMQDNGQKPQDPISQLVADGTITQEQADAVKEAVPFKGFGGFGGRKGFEGKGFGGKGFGGPSGFGGFQGGRR